jgi:hypothetical protein
MIINIVPDNLENMYQGCIDGVCSFERSGAVLVGASPYVGLLLDSADEAEREK